MAALKAAPKHKPGVCDSQTSGPTTTRATMDFQTSLLNCLSAAAQGLARSAGSRSGTCGRMDLHEDVRRATGIQNCHKLYFGMSARSVGMVPEEDFKAL